ncbi:MAG: hypothetical protein ACI9ON_001323 [Limisphaerales bacterium]|jgi:hypothetical protein
MTVFADQFWLVRNAMSGIALTDSTIVQKAMEKLQGDLMSGVWHARYADLLTLGELDLGYRIVKSGPR